MCIEEELRADIAQRISQLLTYREAQKEFLPGKNRIHYAGRVFDEKEILAAADSVLDTWLTLGIKGQEFITAFTKYMGIKHGLVTNSGSSANLLAVSALCSQNISKPVRKGAEVITTALAFPTTLNPIIQNGLIPVFIDIEEGTYNMDASQLENAVTQNTSLIMTAHTLGNPLEMDVIKKSAVKNKLYIIEDVCDALDSRYAGELCGTFGDLSTYSFYAAHHITMGEGGAVLTDNPELYREAVSIRDWGRACFCRTGETNPLGSCGHRFDYNYPGLPEGYDHKYVYSNIGYNLKPLDVQCAIGIEQLKKLPSFTTKRKSNFRILYDTFKKYEESFILPRALPKADPSWFAFPLTVRKAAGFSNKDFVTYLESKNIETRMLFSGNILKHPAYRNIECKIAGELKNTDSVLEGAFFLGVYPGLEEVHLEYITSEVEKFMKR